MMARLIIGAVGGGLMGFAMYRYVGCASGACPITSNPWISTIYGVIVGVLLSGAS